MDTPGWVDEAVGGLVTAAILALVKLWRYGDKRSARIRAALLLLIAGGTVAYVVMQGWLLNVTTAVLSVAAMPVPLWRGLLIGAALATAGLVILGLKSGRARAVPPAPPAADTPKPIIEAPVVMCEYVAPGIQGRQETVTVRNASSRGAYNIQPLSRSSRRCDDHVPGRAVPSAEGTRRPPPRHRARPWTLSQSNSFRTPDRTRQGRAYERRDYPTPGDSIYGWGGKAVRQCMRVRIPTRHQRREVSPDGRR